MDPLTIPVAWYGSKNPATTALERFQQVLSGRMQAFSAAQTGDDRRQYAIAVLNIFRAIFSSPVVPGFHPVSIRAEYQRAVEIITKAVSLPWCDLDVSQISQDQLNDVEKLKEWLFRPERIRPVSKMAGLFGTLSVESLEKDYLSAPDEWYGTSQEK